MSGKQGEWSRIGELIKESLSKVTLRWRERGGVVMEILWKGVTQSV